MALGSDESRQQWRARRLARRAKQREQNIVRAQKMHEARLRYQTDETLFGGLVQSPKLPAALVGCSGWYYWHWRECFYPPDIPGSQWFDFYASQFDTVELNAPFYSWPTPGTIATWLRQAGRRKFVYTVKVCELITHRKKFVGSKTLVRDFCYIADLLGNRMGCFLFQLPPSFRYTPAALKRVLDSLDPSRRNVVEFRHRSWWNDDVFKAFHNSGTIFCSCSGPRLPDELVKTTDEVYLRFHGTKRWYRHNYTKEELAVWAQRIRDSGAKRVWAYFNNDREGYAIKNARELMRQLRNV
jgi:uncharacterized protein YecE (DUF72 family)